MFFNYFLFCVAHYHTDRVCVITQFCHTRLAWIVCIIGSCGQYEAICCEITRPCGGMVDRLHTAPPPAWLPILRPRYLKCMQHFCFHGLGEKPCLFNLPILITDFLISSLFSTWSRFALKKKKKNKAEVYFFAVFQLLTLSPRWHLCCCDDIIWKVHLLPTKTA